MANNDELIGKRIEPIPAEPQEIGIDVDDDMIMALLDGVDVDKVDMTTLDSFTNITMTRENIYTLIDTMASDDRVSAVLETFTEDCVETNDEGQVVWCESSDPDVANFVGYLLDVLNVDKNAYEWVYSLLRYGDLYLRLYRRSDYERDDDFLFNTGKKKQDGERENLFEGLEESEPMNEDVVVSYHKPDDHYVHYVEMVPNPGEMFELTKFGKTRGYISAPINIQEVADMQTQVTNYLTYKLKQKDVTVFGATDFVHASLRNTNNLRSPEEVKVFKDDGDYATDSNAGVYKVKRGQSMLFNKFRIWRQLCMTENSILLDRVTKSALIRLISIETAGMPKNKVQEFLARLKSKIEQKISLSVDNGSMANYTNPGPIVNTIFTPTRDGQGVLSVQTVGGDYDPKQLTDLDHLETRFYGSFRVPKAYFNLTDDGAGFNGGQSLAILSSRYGKAIKQYQNIFLQAMTDLINLFCLDCGYGNYVNKFTLRMQAPVTQEEVDKRENMRNRMGIVQDVMSQTGNLEIDDLTKLKMYKELLSTAISDPVVISLIQERIAELEKEIEEGGEKPTKEGPGQGDEGPSEGPLDDFGASLGFGSRPEPMGSMGERPSEEPTEEPMGGEEAPETAGEDSYLPNPNELGQNFVDND